MPTNNLIEKARSGYDSFNKRDFNTLLSLFSDRFEYRDLSLNRTVQGKEAFKQYSQELLTAFPDGKVEIKNMIATADFIVTEYLFVGTHKGSVMSKMTGREIRPTNKRVELPVCEVTRYESGKAVSIHAYSDSLTMIRQLGLESELGHLAA